MLCSTIIPTVNRPTLERAVESALEQDLGPELHEILVFNNSEQPLQETDWLTSPQITIVNSHSNVIDASNKGAVMASGKYIHFLHDDDYLLPNALKSLINKAELSDCSWVHGAYKRIDNNGQFMSVDRPTIEGNIFALLLTGECLHFAPSLINREAYLEVGGLDPKIELRTDLDLQCRFALVGDYAYIDQIVACVRVGIAGEGSTQAWFKVKQDHRALREKALNAPGALDRLLVSTQDDAFLRGRVCRASLSSMALNLLRGHPIIALKRLYPIMRVTSFYLLFPAFWRGLRFRSHWHAVEKRKEEDHYKRLRAARNVN